MKRIWFLVLVNLFVIFAWVNFEFSKVFRIALIFLQSIFFVLWGAEILSEEKRFKKKYLAEYIFLAFIALALVLNLIYYD